MKSGKWRLDQQIDLANDIEICFLLLDQADFHLVRYGKNQWKKDNTPANNVIKGLNSRREK